METIVKTDDKGNVIMPEGMEDDMIKAGSKLPQMVKALRRNGWRTFEHHDNWIREKDFDPEIKPSYGYDTGNAYNIMQTENIINLLENE